MRKENTREEKQREEERDRERERKAEEQDNRIRGTLYPMKVANRRP